VVAATMTPAAPRISAVAGPVDSRRGRIELRGVSKSYGVGPYARQVIKDCGFAIEPGKLNVIIGPSGCGKTTLLKLMAGFERADGGMVLMDGDPIRAPGPDRLVVFQETALFSWMTAYENIVFGPRARGEYDERARTLAASLLERVGLTDFRDKFPSQLSGGMQRRVELARAMINNPVVMLLDEPFRGLDAMTKVLMQEYFVQLYEESPRTVVFITTDIDEAILLADRLFILSNLPAGLRAEIAVDLPRPRKLKQIFEDDRANDIKLIALRILHEEAMKSFQQGSKAAADLLDAYVKRIS
jgi:NitT/TauT family transport system ATP-binding protein